MATAAARPPGRVLPTVLGMLLLLMAAGQLADLPAFVDILADYDAGPAPVLAALLIMGVLIAGAGLLVAPRRQPMIPALVFTATSVLWTVYLGRPLRWLRAVLAARSPVAVPA